MGRNMQAFLTNIRSEPGQWTAPALARDFGVTQTSVRRSLRNLEDLGLVEHRTIACEDCGQKAVRWFPVDQSLETTE